MINHPGPAEISHKSILKMIHMDLNLEKMFKGSLFLKNLNQINLY